MSNYGVRDVIDRVLVDQRCSLHTAFPARVVAYDAATQTVDVSPALRREVPTDEPREPWAFEALPDPIVHVPVMWQRGGGFALTFPLRPGDSVLIVCAEQSTLLWRQTGEPGAEPGINDPHGLNGLVALPGWFPDTARLSTSTTGVELVSEDRARGLSIEPDGTIVLGQQDGSTALSIESDGTIVLGQRDGSTALIVKPSDGTVHVGALGIPLAIASKVKGEMADLAGQMTVEGGIHLGQSKEAVDAVAKVLTAWAKTFDVAATKAMGI